MTVSDSDGATDTDTSAVDGRQRRADGDPDRRRPTADEGATHTYSFTVTDPGADTFTLVDIDCGANGTQVGPDTFTRPRVRQLRVHLPRRPGLDTVSVTVSDSDGAADTDDRRSR